jgi:DNA-binding HxlR family transcriptional regulator
MATMKNNERRSSCPLSFALEMFGDKWTLLILRDMIFFGKNTYSDFLKMEEKIASNIASDRLQKLLENGFIQKKESNIRQKHVPYQLTDKAIDLVPVIIDLIEWGVKYGEGSSMQDVALKARKNRSKVISQTQQQISVARS